MRSLTPKKLFELRRELYFIKKLAPKASNTELGALAHRIDAINEALLSHWIKIKKDTNKLLNIKVNKEH